MRYHHLIESKVMAYHGSKQDSVIFDPTHLGDNSHTFGNYNAKRTGIFFSDNPEYSAMYGEVQKYHLNIQNTATNLLEYAFRVASELDAHDSNERPLWLSFMNISRGSSSWELFEDDVGDLFVPWLVDNGYDSAQFEEYTEDDDGTEHRSITTVVFDPSKIKRIT
jgi:hypothetical protein